MIYIGKLWTKKNYFLLLAVEVRNAKLLTLKSMELIRNKLRKKNVKSFEILEIHFEIIYLPRSLINFYI